MTFLEFKTAKREGLPPDDGKAGDIFSRLGYRIADAIADLVDNSVDADAKRVHIRFVRGPEGIHSVIIADDGHGMSKDELREAMRFGSRSSKSNKKLGKYGIGLKSASLSQAETVTVLTRRGNKANGRRWTLENVKSNWNCEVLADGDARKAFAPSFSGLRGQKSGTIVVWQRLEHLRALPNNLDRVLERTVDELTTELGIRFHRFLEASRLAISIDQQFGIGSPTGIPTYVTALNPFQYETSGHPSYPLKLKLALSGSSVPVECHIWPPRSNSPGYRLGGGKVALRQGFYFYRNDRVIQAGGWNGIRADDGEPHLSLARVKVDLPAALDSMFKLDVTKSTIDPSPQFIHALQSFSKDGVSFEKYIAQADASYRKQKTKERARFTVIPGGGLSVAAQRAIAAILFEKGAERPKKVAFKWSRLDMDELVRVDGESGRIHLNAHYRRRLSEGAVGDAPVLKVALMFLLQEELGKSFATQKSVQWVQKVNQSLIAALKA